jgi:hypothetical protein
VGATDEIVTANVRWLAVLPVLFHLLWRHELTADLSVPLHPGTLVSPVMVTR